MKKRFLQDTYRDLYYHELDVREKITNRIQLSFALHITALTILAYVLRMVDHSAPIILLTVVYLGLLIFVVLIARSVYEAVKAFWGNTYKALASANEIANYKSSCISHKAKLQEYKKKYPSEEIPKYRVNKKVFDYIYSNFAECASHNSAVNDARSVRIHNATKFLLYSLIPFLISTICFTMFDMDASSPRKKLLIEYDGIVESLDKIPGRVSEEITKSVQRSDRELKTATSSLAKSVDALQLLLETPRGIETMHRENNQDPPPPPPEPDPPEPRDLIESQDIDIDAGSEMSNDHE